MSEQSKTQKATHEGKVQLGQTELNCYVLSDGTRLISQNAVFKAFGRGKRGIRRLTDTGIKVPSFMDAKNLDRFIDNDLEGVINPIEILTKNGQRVYGYKAEVIPLVCDLYLKARDADVLTPQQLVVAKTAEILVRSLAKVGIIALIDEATGYQEIRQRDALQKILEKYLLKEYATWAKCFPLEFYEEMFRLRGWILDKRTMKMPQVVGRFTNDIIYDRLAPGVLEELRLRNPVLPTGRRKTKHHQWLTEDIGHPALNMHFSGVLALMRANTKWVNFKRSLERAYPKLGQQMTLLFNDDEEND